MTKMAQNEYYDEQGTLWSEFWLKRDDFDLWVKDEQPSGYSEGIIPSDWPAAFMRMAYIPHDWEWILIPFDKTDLMKDTVWKRYAKEYVND